VAASSHILNITVTTRIPFAPVSEKRWQNMPKIRQNPGFSAKLGLIEAQPPPLVAMGHCHWPQPLVRDLGTQLLNLDSCIVYLTPGI
ncbi:MAG: hypothetical protein ACI8W8_002176, partial [Rhodothermales bacterium]